MKMGYTVPDEAVLRPNEARQSLKAKEKLEREIKVLKKKIESHSQTPPTPPPNPTTPPNPTIPPTNLSPKRPTRRLDTQHFTHSIIRKALLHSVGKKKAHKNGVFKHHLPYFVSRSLRHCVLPGQLTKQVKHLNLHSCEKVF